MYGSQKKLATVSIIIAVLNAVLSMMLYLSICDYIVLDASASISVYGFLFTIPAIFLITTLTLRRFAIDIEDNGNRNFEETAELKKKVKELEAQIELLKNSQNKA